MSGGRQVFSCLTRSARRSCAMSSTAEPPVSWRRWPASWPRSSRRPRPRSMSRSTTSGCPMPPRSPRSSARWWPRPTEASPSASAFDAGKPTAGTAEDFARLEADPAPLGTSAWVTAHFGGTEVQTKAITAGGQLMHSKYVVRDATAGSGHLPAVWTGSTNFTDDAWTRQENNVIVVSSAAMATSYRADFDADVDGRQDRAEPGRADRGARRSGRPRSAWDFCPGDGAAINTALAARVAAASKRLIIATMVLTSHEVLAALSHAIDGGIALTGIYDGGQMDPIVEEWKKVNSSASGRTGRTCRPSWSTSSPRRTRPTGVAQLHASEGADLRRRRDHRAATTSRPTPRRTPRTSCTSTTRPSSAHYETYLDAVISAYS